MEKSRARVLPYQIILALKNWSGRDRKTKSGRPAGATQKNPISKVDKGDGKKERFEQRKGEILETINKSNVFWG